MNNTAHWVVAAVILVLLVHGVAFWYITIGPGYTETATTTLQIVNATSIKATSTPAVSDCKDREKKINTEAIDLGLKCRSAEVSADCDARFKKLNEAMAQLIANCDPVKG